MEHDEQSSNRGTYVLLCVAIVLPIIGYFLLDLIPSHGPAPVVKDYASSFLDSSVTHASQSVPAMSINDQQHAAALGVFIEHGLLAATPCLPGRLSLENIEKQIRAVGIEHCILKPDR